MENSADTTAKNEIGDMPLADSVQSSGSSWYEEQILEIVQILLDKGAEVNVKNDNGDTALTRATKNNNQEVTNLLLSRGAKLE
jgi:ankyrin repeat protein